MYFKDRRDAGRQLSQRLTPYQNQQVIVYALPRGGIVLAEEIANALHAPLDLILAHKIGHPYQAEYAIAAISENGHMVGTQHELLSVNQTWLEQEKKRQLEEIKRKRNVYLKGKPSLSAKDKIAIIVDDGIATGLTMQVGILQLKDQHPKKIVVAVPVSPKQTADLLKTLVDDVVAIEIPGDHQFLGAVGAYYQYFDQVEDDEVIAILDQHAKQFKS